MSILFVISLTGVLLSGCCYIAMMMRQVAVDEITVNPFSPETPATSADTITDQAVLETQFTDSGWQYVKLNKLCDVEEFLDGLECCGEVTESEMIVNGNNSFTVRWR